MSSSPISFLGAAIGAFGSTIVNSTGSFTNGNFCALSTVGGQGFSLAAVSGSGITNISALTGVTFTAPTQFLGHITSFRLSSGVCQAINQI
jgi:hypothetical protein